METNLEKISALLKESELIPEDVEILLQICAQVDDADLEGMLELFQENNSWITIINDNFKAKRAAFSTDDTVAMETILKEEEDLLNQIT